MTTCTGCSTEIPYPCDLPECNACLDVDARCPVLDCNSLKQIKTDVLPSGCQQYECDNCGAKWSNALDH